MALTLAVGALGLLGATAPAALADPVLDVRALQMPTHFPPGGSGRYEVPVTNVGDADTTGDPVIVTIALPAGMTATEATDPFGGAAWACVISPDGKIATCELGIGPIEAQRDACQQFGVLCPIVLTVDVAPDASGQQTASVQACGGGASACGSYDVATTISATPAPFGIATLENEVLAADRSSSTQAGAHPAVSSTRVAFNTVRIPSDPSQFRVDTPEDPKTVSVDLPVGFTGDPTGVARCSTEDFWADSCPLSSQVGTLSLRTEAGLNGKWAVYNLEAPPDTPAYFGAQIPDLGVPIFLRARVRTGGDYGLTIDVPRIPQVDTVLESVVTIWGHPSDPSHDPERGPCLGGGECPTDAPRTAFLTNPTNCQDPAVRASAESWQQPGIFTSVTVSQPEIVGCQNLQFEPEFSVQPTNSQAHAPSGYEVEIRIPQNDDPDGLATSHLKRAAVTFPAGVSVSPSAAHGLGACREDEIGLANSAAPSCPESSQIGTARVETPLLDEPLTGRVYLAKPRENRFNTLIAIYLVARGPGVLVKVPGRVALDPTTGQLTAVFDDNPQLPFSRLSVQLKGGSTAPLVNPPTCGQKTAVGELTPWSGGAAEQRVDSFTISCPGSAGFSPAFSAGTLDPAAGQSSPFVLRFERRDRQEYLGGLSVELPAGVLAKLRGVPLCADQQAATGQCPAESRVGSAKVGAGAGPTPFFIADQPVYLTEGYKGAPYGLAVVVRAIAGPFDLGTIVVRQAVFVDPVDAHITVVSDPLPTILEGIPLRLRSVVVEMDRPGFTMNPTSCSEKQIVATLISTEGAVHRATQRFQAADCRALPLRPRLGLRLTGRRQVRDGRHPGLRAVLRQGAGQANLRKVAVRLPLSLALDPDNARSLCEFEDGLRVSCPRSSIIGSAVAHTPILNRPLRGPVYFVKGVRIDPKTGRRIRTLPTLLIPLRGEVAIDLRARSSVRQGRLVNTFEAVPDAPVSRFELNLAGGRNGILVVTNRRNLCRGRHVAEVEIDGQNGKRADSSVRMRTPCARRR